MNKGITMKKKIVFFLLFFGLQISLFASVPVENHAVILQYHRFGETRYPSTNIQMKQFRYQLHYLKSHHYNVWPLSKIIRYIEQKKPFPPKTVALTMDDAYRTVYTHAFALLKADHFPFTVFVNTLPIIHKSKRYLTWNQMREMAKYGAEYANHTYSHPFMVRKYKEDSLQWKKVMTGEITKAQTTLQKELGNAVVTNPKMLCYPFGEFDKRLMKLTKSLGYVGIAQNSGPVNDATDLLAVPRFPMSQKFATKKGFLLKLHTLVLPIASVSTDETVVTKENNPPLLEITLQRPVPLMQCFTANGKKIEMRWLSKTKVRIVSVVPLQYPRDHYTCTAPAQNGRWYWYSHFWVIMR
jgi:poly-beta-1,6-N-acetyl-D-glucosamine N-deacetylase